MWWSGYLLLKIYHTFFWFLVWLPHPSSLNIFILWRSVKRDNAETFSLLIKVLLDKKLKKHRKIVFLLQTLVPITYKKIGWCAVGSHVKWGKGGGNFFHVKECLLQTINRYISGFVLKLANNLAHEFIRYIWCSMLHQCKYPYLWKDVK